MADVTLTVVVPEASLPTLDELTGGGDAQAWLCGLVAQKLQERLLADASNAAAATYNAAMSAAQAEFDATLEQAKADVAAISVTAGVAPDVAAVG